LIVWTAALAVLTAVILIGGPRLRQTKPKAILDLKVADQNGRMRIDWDPSNPAIQAAQGATLEVEDGGVFNRYPVEAHILRSGGLDYVRRTQDVFLTLTLYQDGRPGLQSTVRRISPVQIELADTNEKPARNESRTRRR
jgi:hypothetical protein